jgi:hypothetical protein
MQTNILNDVVKILLPLLVASARSLDAKQAETADASP